MSSSKTNSFCCMIKCTIKGIHLDICHPLLVYQAVYTTKSMQSKNRYEVKLSTHHVGSRGKGISNIVVHLLGKVNLCYQYISVAVSIIAVGFGSRVSDNM